MLNDKFKTPDDIPPSYYRAKIIEPLKKGTITLNNNLIAGSIFEVATREYMIVKLLKIDGFANYKVQIKKCEGQLDDIDENHLVKDLVIKIKYAPIDKIRPGYDL